MNHALRVLVFLIIAVLFAALHIEYAHAQQNKKQQVRVLVATVPTMVRSEYEPFLLIARALAAQSNQDFEFSIYFASSNVSS